MTTADIRCPHCGQVAASLILAEPFIQTTDKRTIEEGLKIRIAEYPWPLQQRVRIIRACTDNGWTTFRDLCALDGEFILMRQINIGRQSVDGIKCALGKYGLHIGMINTVK